MANTIGIGRRSGITGDDLSDWEWGEFRSEVRQAVEHAGGQVIFSGTGQGIWEGVEEDAACIVFLGGDDERGSTYLLHWLSVLAARYGQDAIALTQGETVFVAAGRCNNCGQDFDAAAWDSRHTDNDGEDVHDACCNVCQHGAGEHG